jgi:hypothetical protein
MHVACTLLLIGGLHIQRVVWLYQDVSDTIDNSRKGINP